MLRLCFLLYSVLVIAYCAQAQSPEYYQLQDVDYTVSYDDKILTVKWQGEPAGDQLKQIDHRRYLLLDDQGEPRLILYVGKPFRYYDAKYANPEWFAYALAALENPAIDQVDSPVENDELPAVEPLKELSVTFKNGLVFTLSDGQPFALLNNQQLLVTGSAGRYRIDTKEFEAGVAIMRDQRIYQYLRPKATAHN